MRSLAFSPTPRTIYAGYGRTELRRLYEFHWMIGFFIAVGLHVALLSLIPIEYKTTVVPPNNGPAVVELHPYVIPPVINVGKRPKIQSTIKVGTPVPSPVQVDDYPEKDEIPSGPIGDFAGEEGSGEGDGGGGVGGPIPGENSDIVIPVPIYLVEKEPQVVRIEKPEYPPLAVKAGIEGTVWVKILVDKEGHASKTQLIKSTHEIFEEPALSAAKKFLFTPAYMTGGPVYVWISLPFRFTLK
ncbi:MAG TPA: energy transducer TonB [Bacteroidota bacterium]